MRDFLYLSYPNTISRWIWPNLAQEAEKDKKDVKPCSFVHAESGCHNMTE